MTQAKASQVVAALVTAGYVPSVSNDGNTPANWTITVAVTGGMPASTVAAFASGRSVTAIVPSAVFT